MRTIINIRKSLAIALFMCFSATVSAQEVSTLFFLENAPMRHLVNPAFQPVSNGYLNFTPLGYTSIGVNLPVTANDLIFKDSQSGSYITPLHPNADKQKFLKQLPNGSWSLASAPLADASITLDLLSFGFRYKQKGYVHIGIMEHIEIGTSMPKELFRIFLDGGLKNVFGVNHLDFMASGTQAAVYTEVSGGYSHKINDQWTVGGKLKFLLGHAYTNITHDRFDMDLSHNEWIMHNKLNWNIAAPVELHLPDQLSYEKLRSMSLNEIIGQFDIKRAVKPIGYGAAIDFGFTYKPHPQVQISAAINDLGFMYWYNGTKYNMSVDTVFHGLDEIAYNVYMDGNHFQGDKLANAVVDALEKYAYALKMTGKDRGFTRMLNAKLNVGFDFNFCNNILGLGVLSHTRLFNGRLYEEVTVGGALRPCNWFNFALSYSLLNNGKYTNVGAGLSFMPYDGVNMTLALDYIPTHWAIVNDKIPVPHQLKSFNVALGFSIVWGTNRKRDADRDGVKDKYDMCLGTPRGVRVDVLGCPIDNDGDGVPDYLDSCLVTSEKAYGYIDSLGCPIDSDGDGVPDYLDDCPCTPAQARGFVDEHGCILDTDGDGVPDYIDKCPNTPYEAAGYVDSVGCELDSDGDGVPDWRDICPNTPPEAYSSVDISGCPKDSDGDGVPDYQDECPDTPEGARGYVDDRGCELDTDGDGIPDWKDECPTVKGPKYNKGCPEVKREIRNLLKKAMQGIQFETGKAVIKKASFPLMDKIAQSFIDNPDFVIEVQGHTDNVGKPAMNKRLSQKRAESVRNYLIKAGVDAKRMTAVGYGQEKPIADNKTAAGRKENRRVEFQITFEQISYETVYEHADSTLLKQHLDSIQAIELQKQDN